MTGKFRCAFAGAALAVLAGGPTHASCASEEAQAQQILTRFASKTSSMGICDMAIEVERTFPQILNFYERCPINDPNSQVRSYLRQMIDWSRQTKVATCN